MHGINDKVKWIPISDSQRYRQMGNAVTVNVIEWIGNHYLVNWKGCSPVGYLAITMSNIQCLESFIKENPMEGFDICSKCGAIQEANTMQDINQTDFNI